MPAKKAKYGYKKDGTRKKKPGPKKSGKRKSPKRKSTAGKRKSRKSVGKRCASGRTAAGKCRKRAYYGQRRLIPSIIENGAAVYERPMYPLRKSGLY